MAKHEKNIAISERTPLLKHRKDSTNQCATVAMDRRFALWGPCHGDQKTMHQTKIDTELEEVQSDGFSVLQCCIAYGHKSYIHDYVAVPNLDISFIIAHNVEDTCTSARFVSGVVRLTTRKRTTRKSMLLSQTDDNGILNMCVGKCFCG